MKKSETWANDGTALNFLTEIDSTDCSAGFGEIRFLKWRDINNLNSWFLTMLNGLSEGFLKFIRANIFS